MVVKINTKNYGLLEHPYWKRILEISSQEEISHVKIISSKPREIKRQFLDYIVQGFYPLSSLAQRVFKRAAALTSGDAHGSAQRLYEVEAGEHPFGKGTHYEGMPHAEQFRELIESLEGGCHIKSPYKNAQELAQNLGIKEASLDEVLAYTSVIEHRALHIVHAFEDFVAQWQTYNGRKSVDIRRNFLLEHGLTEGSESEEQHVSVVEMAVDQYKDRIRKDVFDKAVDKLIKYHHEQLDAVYTELMKLVNS